MLGETQVIEHAIVLTIDQTDPHRGGLDRACRPTMRMWRFPLHNGNSTSTGSTARSQSVSARGSASIIDAAIVVSPVLRCGSK
jgi:hypothetical protein